MSDIVIARICFPNDPTSKLVAHQMFVGEQTGTQLHLYSVSSILGKEKRVYGPNKEDYITILPPEHGRNGFKVPSFIDCTKMYNVELSDAVNIETLTQRSIETELRKKIVEKVEEMKACGRHEVYSICTEDFKR